ncbi:hypothetical protein [Lentzea atacamensis]|uniref:hypothetical protein n=1 Tax=Lentzea atacamensis TaxID=531938 RepID=UPI000DD4691C|nr:hypothetical protein [Lentzea atacamensis]
MTELPPSADRYWAVFVRFPDQKTAQRVTPDGHTTRRKAHAAMLTRAEAERVVELTEPYRRTPSRLPGADRALLI